MHLIRQVAAQILVVFLVEKMELFIDKPGVFLLKDSPEYAFFRIAVLVVATVFGNFVDKE